MVDEITSNLRNIPNTIKLLKALIAHKLVLWEGLLEEEDLMRMRDMVKECRVGWLVGVGQSCKL